MHVCLLLTECGQDEINLRETTYHFWNSLLTDFVLREKNKRKMKGELTDCVVSLSRALLAG